MGSDEPSPPATKGYFINHLCLNVRNATESIEWYNIAFGLRLVFTLRPTEHTSISYMAHAAGGKNGTGYQTAEEMNRDKNNREGLLELVSLELPSWNLKASSQIPNTFSHIGMVVPDIEATQKRLKKIGANIIKNFGEPVNVKGAVGNALGFGNLLELDQGEIDAFQKATTPANLGLIFVADPDGNLIEVQGQEGFGLV